MARKPVYRKQIDILWLENLCTENNLISYGSKTCVQKTNWYLMARKPVYWKQLDNLMARKPVYRKQLHNLMARKPVYRKQLDNLMARKPVYRKQLDNLMARKPVCWKQLDNLMARKPVYWKQLDNLMELFDFIKLYFLNLHPLTGLSPELKRAPPLTQSGEAGTSVHQMAGWDKSLGTSQEPRPRS